MKIVVDAEAIKNGIAKNRYECPVALAIRKAGYKTVFCCPNDILVGRELGMAPSGPGMRRIFLDPAHPARSFMFAFDKGEPVEPFEFELEEVQ